MDLIDLPQAAGVSEEAEDFAEKFKKLHQEVMEYLEQSNAKYKIQADRHRRRKHFNIGDIVMVYLQKARFLQCSQQD